MDWMERAREYLIEASLDRDMEDAAFLLAWIRGLGMSVVRSGSYLVASPEGAITDGLHHDIKRLKDSLMTIIAIEDCSGRRLDGTETWPQEKP